MESEQTVLITGASTGIGLAVARALSRTKYRVFLTARQESLPRFDVHAIGESENIRIRPLDVTNAEEREALIAEAERDWALEGAHEALWYEVASTSSSTTPGSPIAPWWSTSKSTSGSRKWT